MDDSVILCDEFIYTEETKTIPKYVTFKTQNLSILLLSLLIAIALMIAVSIYCYLRKYQAKNYALDSIKQMDLLEFIMKLAIQ